MARTSRVEPIWIWSLAFYFCSLVIAVSAALILHGLHPGKIENLANFMGPLAENLAHGRGYIVCGAGMGAAGNVICFHANRMPLPPFLLAVLIRVFGNHPLAVELAKIAVVLLPVTATAVLVAANLPSPSSRAIRLITLGILLFGLALPIQLIDVINMQVEEGYSFCLLAYAVAVLFFVVVRQMPSWSHTLSFALSVLGLYLTKSSMIAAAAFLVPAFWLQVPDARKRIAVLLIVLCGPLGWGIYTLRATGKFSVGTSLDGINLHKGNYAEFLDRYPPAPGVGLDQYDEALSNNKDFSSEWAFNAYHMRAAESYIQTHASNTVRATFWKVEVFFFSLQKIGSEHYVGWLGRITFISLVLFRLLLWSACVVAAWLMVTGNRQARWSALIYFGTVLTTAAPYLVGFALTRHASVLSLPSALFLSWFVMRLHLGTGGVAE